MIGFYSRIPALFYFVEFWCGVIVVEVMCLIVNLAVKSTYVWVNSISVCVFLDLLER